MANALHQTRFVNWSLSVALIVMAALGVYYTAHNSDAAGRARSVQSITMDPPPDQLKAGATFVVTVRITVYQVCPFELRWTLTNDENEAILYMIEPPVTYPGLGEQTVVSPHYIPAHVKPGHYVYEVQAFDMCDDRAKLATPVRRDVIVH